MTPAASAPAAAVAVAQEGETLQVVVSGHWRVGQTLPDPTPIVAALDGGAALRLAAERLDAWDSSLLVFLLRLYDAAVQRQRPVDCQPLPDGLAGLIRLARVVPRAAQPPIASQPTWLEHIGHAALARWRSFPEWLAFIGELTLATLRFFIGRARYRQEEFFWLIEECGPRALPIVSLISFLVGTILAYMGATQLALFGAQIYIADLVGIGMVREIAALMTGIILAGRTGAAFAAQLGTMQVNEEIDALRTLGIPVIEFLVLPRVLALLLMAPLLTLYASVVGVLAGALIAALVYDVGFNAYYFQTVAALNLPHFLVGLFKGTVYAGLVAFAGCLCGMRCGRSAQAVGEATTAAVVLGILLITISAALLTIAFQRLGI